MNEVDISSPKLTFSLVIALVAAFSGILFGYDTGVISGVILFIQDQFHLSPQMNGIVVSSVLLGALLGAMLSGYFSDHFGRKYLLIIDAILFIIGTMIASLSKTITLLILGRLIVGIAIGIASYTAPLYIAEISPSRYRGALVSLNQLAIAFGILLSYVIDYIFAWYQAWRYMLAFGLIPAILLLIGMIFLPFSPRWALSRGYVDQAKLILKRIYGDSTHQAEQALLAIKKSLNAHKGGLRDLLAKNVRPAFVVGVGLAFFQQVTGINTILYYAPTVFYMTGYHQETAAILATLGIGIIFLLFTILAVFLIDKIGRRPLLLIGIAVMALSLIVLSTTFFLLGVSSKIRSQFAFFSILIYIAGFAISLGPIVWLMIAEVFPLRIRGIGSSLSTCVNWLFNWLVAITFLTLIQYLGIASTFFLYAMIAIINLCFVYKMIPETKGVSLEQIEKNLYNGKSARHLGC